MLRPIEKLIYRVAEWTKDKKMRWTEYTVAMLLFSGVSMVLLYLIERMQLLAALQSAEVGQRAAGSGVQHRRFVHHEYQLAELLAANRR